MNETTPNYIIELRDHLDKKIEKEVGDLANITAKSFADIEKRMATKEDTATKSDVGDLEYELSVVRNEMATKEEVREILSHIGRYEVRAQNTEAVVHEDHKPRIVGLEKTVFA